MKVRYWFSLLCASMMLQACYENKGNYDYVDVNEVTIKLPKTYYPNIPIGDTIRIVPAITYKHPEDTSYFTYEWYLDEQLVSESRDLAVTWPELGSTYGDFRVTDTRLEAKYIVQFEINQISPYEFGWMVLYEQGGKSEFCYIQKSENGYKSFPDFYRQRNQEELGSRPYRMVEHYTPSSSEILIIQYGGQGCVEVDGKSFEKKVTTRQEFLGETLPEHFMPIDASYSGYVNYILNEDGALYSRLADPKSMHTHYYSTLPLAENGKQLKIGRILQTVDSKTYYILLFDLTNNRFVGVLTRSSGNEGRLMSLYRESYPEEVLPLDNLGDNELVFAAAYQEGTYTSNFAALFKDAAGGYFYQVFNVEFDPIGALVVRDVKRFQPEATGMFQEAKVFHLLKRRPYIFFVSGAEQDQLYYLDLETKAVKLYKSFDGVAITALSSDKESGLLGVGLENGEFCLFDVADQLLGREVKMVYNVKNLGKIVDVIYKYGTLANYESGL